MTAQPESDSFVLLRLSERRFALAAGDIAELVAPSRIFRFPHQTKEVEGVVVRRGRIVPVIDVAGRLLGKRLAARRLPGGESNPHRPVSAAFPRHPLRAPQDVA